MKISVSFLILFSVFITVSSKNLVKAPEYGLRSPTWLNYYVFLRRGKKSISENVLEEENANINDGSNIGWAKRYSEFLPYDSESTYNNWLKGEQIPSSEYKGMVYGFV